MTLSLFRARECLLRKMPVQLGVTNSSLAESIKAHAGQDDAREKLNKGGSPFPIRTRRPSLPIISSLKALFARWPFHPRTPVRSFVSLLTTCLQELGTTALIFVRFYVSPPGRIQPASGLAGSLTSASRNDSAPAMERCQSQRGAEMAEIRSMNQAVVAARSGIPSARVCIRRYSRGTGDR